MEKIKIGVLFFLLIIVCSCTKKEPGPGVGGDVGDFNLISPLKNEACKTGTNLTLTQSTLNFSWTAAQNAEQYEFTVKNLVNNQIITQTTSQTSLNIAIDFNAPYSWQVKALSSKSTVSKQTETWKFYNAGPGTTFYAPYPAEMIFPLMNQSVTSVGGKIELKWFGADPDNDIESYSVYMGPIANNMATTVVDKQKVTSGIVTVIPGTTYYWKVYTYDVLGNLSDSGTYKFTVN